MKVFAYGVALGAGFMTGRGIYNAIIAIVLRMVFGKAGYAYITGKGPKPDYTNKGKSDS